MALHYQLSPSGPKLRRQDDVNPPSANNVNDPDMVTFRLASHISEGPRDERRPPNGRRLEKVMCRHAESLSKPRLKLPSEVKTGGVEWGLTSRVGGFRQDIWMALPMLGILCACDLRPGLLRLFRPHRGSDCLERTFVHVSVIEFVGRIVAEFHLTKVRFL